MATLGSIDGVSSPCEGDSGGPLIVNQRLVGLVSTTACDPTIPATYTEISAFFGWLSEELAATDDDPVM